MARSVNGRATALLGSSWRLDGPPLVLAGESWLACVILTDLVAIYSVAHTPGLVSDFFAFWSAAKFIHTQIPAGIYDPAVLHRFQVALGTDTNLPFLYPPGILLLLWPLALFSYAAAFAIWMAIGLAVYLASTFARRTWTWAMPMLLAAPATVLCVALGQTGLLVGGLLIGGLRLAPSRPVTAGFILGLAAVKPQLGLLVPLALLAAGQWKTLRAATATVVGLALLSSLAFGWTIWPTWVGALPTLARTVVEQQHRLLPIMPTVQGNLELLGYGPLVAGLGQLLAAGLAGWVVVRAFRAGLSRAGSAVLLAATLLATPYALISDLPLATAAVVLLMQEKAAAARPLRTAEIALFGFVVWLPFLMIGLMPLPFSCAPVALLLALAAALVPVRPDICNWAPQPR